MRARNAGDKLGSQRKPDTFFESPSTRQTNAGKEARANKERTDTSRRPEPTSI